jgi:hypothetical protein
MIDARTSDDTWFKLEPTRGAAQWLPAAKTVEVELTDFQIGN